MSVASPWGGGVVCSCLIVCEFLPLSVSMSDCLCVSFISCGFEEGPAPVFLLGICVACVLDCHSGSVCFVSFCFVSFCCDRLHLSPASLEHETVMGEAIAALMSRWVSVEFRLHPQKKKGGRGCA